ncbi:MAG TPA: MBL fold metallo-hydrolase, partial [Bryobacteraceae bacterium]|nr:MBL fold metallo-hydrolase [Bryobacteraceae bacterium]
MIHEILPVGVLACNCSILGDEQTREAMVIDPGDDVADILRVIERHGLKVTLIVVTHAHIDHVGGAQKLKKATGAPVAMSASDLPLYEQIDTQAAWLGVPVPERASLDAPAREGQRLHVGGIELEVLE